MESADLWNTLALTALTFIGGIWTFYKLFYKYKSKVLFITNCQILHKKIWEDMLVAYPKIKEHGTQDHAFRPMVLLPPSLRKYSDIKNGHKAILEYINPHSDKNLKIVAEVFWIPKELKPWSNIKHPVFSLILRRYFGIERPLYQDEKKEDIGADWQLVRHSSQHLDPLHKVDVKEKVNIWAASKSYTIRFFNPTTETYQHEQALDHYIEYCGLSIILHKRSFAQHEKE